MVLQSLVQLQSEGSAILDKKDCINAFNEVLTNPQLKNNQEVSAQIQSLTESYKPYDEDLPIAFYYEMNVFSPEIRSTTYFEIEKDYPVKFKRQITEIMRRHTKNKSMST